MIFVSSASNRENALTRKQVLLLSGVACFSSLLYLGMCFLVYRIGFPLDDAWIHLTYARNLAILGEWSFFPGVISGGSTSPLWTAILSISFLSGISPIGWAYFCGITTLLTISIIVEKLIRSEIPAYQPDFPWVGSIFLLEWHLSWASFSGMETILYILIVIIVISMVINGFKNYLLVGLLTGLSIWIRPDGLLLLFPVIISVIFKTDPFNEKRKNIFLLLFGFSVFFLPYLLFNLFISGTPWPNTFYAKQAEYKNWQLIPIYTRFLYFLLQFFQGVSFVFIPGFVKKLTRSIAAKRWELISAFIWLTGYIVLYVTRLPVYQHGRYEMPALAVFLLLALPVFLEDINYFSIKKTKFGSTILISSFFVILTVSSLFGAYTFAMDTALIESQMVETAKWVTKNIPADEKIAAHDIGALGYYGNHQLVDLAGLVTPEIVPIMTDDQKVIQYLDIHDVKYLVGFPNWRPSLSADSDKIFNVKDNRFLQSGTEGMAVFRQKTP